jgi:hypothetical protein
MLEICCLRMHADHCYYYVVILNNPDRYATYLVIFNIFLFFVTYRFGIFFRQTGCLYLSHQ